MHTGGYNIKHLKPVRGSDMPSEKTSKKEKKEREERRVTTGVGVGVL